MSQYGWLTLYCVLVLLMSLIGGYVPFLKRVTHTGLQFFLTAAAGVMLGACFFHVMPDAMEKAGPNFGWWMALGTIGLFCIERFIAPHSHELDDHGHHHHHHDKEKAAEVLGHAEPHHDHSHDHRSAAPAVAGWMAVLGLTIHTFMNGVGLAGAVQFDADTQAGATAHNPVLLLLPGFALFLAIVLHKPFDALAISMVLSRKGTTQRKISLVQVGFALMVPVGVLAFILTRGAILKHMDDQEHFLNQLTGAALAFSAGTFLFVALSDLLPEVQFHRHDRIPLFATLVAGVVLMGGIGFLEGHDHGDHEHDNHGAQVAPAAGQEHAGDHASHGRALE